MHIPNEGRGGGLLCLCNDSKLRTMAVGHATMDLVNSQRSDPPVRGGFLRFELSVPLETFEGSL